MINEMTLRWRQVSDFGKSVFGSLRLLASVVSVSLASCASVQGPVPVTESEGAGEESFFETLLSNTAFWYVETFADYSETQDVVVEQELKGVTVEMMDWWWDHIDTTQRYRSWHPKDHIYFKWVKAPDRSQPGRYSPGAVQEVRERVGGIPMTLLITWEPYDAPGYPVTKAHFVKASGVLKGGNQPAPQLFLHEYQASEAGIHLRSVFTLPTGLPSQFVAGLKRHCGEEMQYLAAVLPGYYQQRQPN